MKVQDLMSSPAQTCRATDALTDAARIMLDHDCGCLPVIDARGHVAGMITDRDVCVAMAARHKGPWTIPVRDAMTREVFSCAPADDVSTALTMMSEHHVRRLPVIDEEGHIKGLISIDDVMRRSGRGSGQVRPDALLHALRSLAGSFAHRGGVTSS